MKIFRFSLLFGALIGAALLPSCGGGANSKGDQFVSVTAFQSGSVGFMIQGSPYVQVVSRGPLQGINGQNTVNGIQTPDFTMDDFEGENVEESWRDFAGDMAELREGTQSCVVTVRVTNSSENEYSIDGIATYTVAEKLGYLKLNFDEVSGSGGNLEYQALIHFLGAVTQSDLTYNNSEGTGTNTNGTSGTGANRILITTLTGSELRFWFNFETSQAMVELNYTANITTEVTANSQQVTATREHGVWRIVHPFWRYSR